MAMADKKTLCEEIVHQAREHFIREKNYWNRQTEKKKWVSDCEYMAKEKILESIFNAAAAAALECW